MGLDILDELSVVTLIVVHHFDPVDLPDEVPIAVAHSLVDVIRLFHESYPISPNRDVILLYFEELLPVD